MKVLLCFIVLALFTAGYSASGQSRIGGLDPDDIYSIRIIKQSEMGFTDERTVSAESDIQNIVYYLKKYDYRDMGIEEIGTSHDNPLDWKYQIILNGWRDEIYLFDDKVFIGKSAFQLPAGMIREFDRIFRDL